MKKLITIALAALMVFSMAGCASSTKTNQQAAVPTVAAPATTQGTTEATIPASLPEVPDLEPTGSVATEPTATEPAPTEPAEGEFSLGTVDGTTYTNKYVGLTFAGTEGIEYATYEEIMIMNGLAEDATLTTLEAKLGNDSLYLMSAQSETAIANLMITRLDDATIGDISLQEVLEASIETTEASYVAQGFINLEVKYSKVTIGDSQVDALIIVGEIAGQSFQGAMVMYLRENMLISVSAGSIDAEEANEMLRNSVIF